MRTAAVLVLSAAAVTAQDPAWERIEPRAEIGAIAWRRDFDRALADAKQHGKPVFLLFQEIPGCATCTGFGKDVLEHALLKEAIETEFVSVLVRNNVEGPEDAIRRRYEEPAWNNPVVRFVDGDGEDLLPRKDGVWDAHGIARRMVETLQKAKRPVPGYLEVALCETAPKTATAVFRMHCFWEGEAVLGALDGVVATRSLWRGQAEVVEVTFRPDVITEQRLTEHAQAKSCEPVEADGLRPAKASDQQHALGGTVYARLDLTPMQRTKLHAALTLGTDADRWLTPTQRAKLAALRAEDK